MNVPERCIKRASDDMTYPRGRTPVWYSEWLHRERTGGSGFLCGQPTVTNESRVAEGEHGFQKSRMSQQRGLETRVHQLDARHGN